MTLSARAAATISFLRTIPNSAACEKCIAGHIGVDQYKVLESVRELADSVLCTYAECAICGEWRLVTQARGPTAPS
jgi:hypothetical protein